MAPRENVQRIVDARIDSRQPIQGRRRDGEVAEPAVDSPYPEGQSEDRGDGVRRERRVRRLVEQQRDVVVHERPRPEVVEVEDEHDGVGQRHRRKRHEDAKLPLHSELAVPVDEPHEYEHERERNWHQVVADDPLGDPVDERRRADEAVHQQKQLRIHGVQRLRQSFHQYLALRASESA